MNVSEPVTGAPEIIPQQSPCIERFARLFNKMSSDHIGDLADVYHNDARFTDPFTTVTGLPALKHYFENAYSNVIACQFDFSPVITDETGACLPWIMTLQHRRIKGGKPITVHGISHLLVSEDRIISHRDYFDAGELLYENLPVLGNAVRWLRKHAS
ncbi:nuclear transport factor 2 family protein [Marinobacter sp. 1Y8]